jgi:copper chaperone CopZ
MRELYAEAHWISERNGIANRGFMSEITLNIDGMHCGACVKRVSQALEHLPGAEVMEVRIGAARVKTEDPDQALAVLAKAGYSAHQVA